MLIQLARRELRTHFGTFQEILFYNGQKECIALVMGEVGGAQDVLCRVHSACLAGHVFNSAECDCREQMEFSQRAIQQVGRGVIIFLDQEGKGNGHLALMQSIPHKKAGLKQGAAYEAAGFRADARDFSPAAEILKNLKITSIRLLTDNPAKAAELEKIGIRVADILTTAPKNF